LNFKTPFLISPKGERIKDLLFCLPLWGKVWKGV